METNYFGYDDSHNFFYRLVALKFVIVLATFELVFTRFWETTFQTKKLRGLSPRANYTDRATAACRRS
jgi:hypothetical protein